MDLLLILIIGALLGCLFALSWFAGSDAPYVATKIALIPKILKAAGVRKDKIFYELGSGDGRVVFEAAKLGAKSFGVEQSWLRVWYSRYRAAQLGLKNTHFFHGNIFERNYYSADVLYLFLLPKGIAKLEKKLPQELKKGSLIITQTYHFKCLRPVKKIFIPAAAQQIYLGKNKKAGDFWIYRV